MALGTPAPGIVVYCKKCGKKNRAPAAAAGGRGVCAQCGAQMTIPTESEAGPPAAEAPPPVAPVEQRAAPEPLEKPRPAPTPLPARAPADRTAPPREGKEDKDAPLDENLSELDDILKDLDSLLPAPDAKRTDPPRPSK
jgi:hypothetical protein